MRRGAALALAAVLGCASDAVDLDRPPERLVVEPQAISGIPGQQATIVARLEGARAPTPGPVRWTSSKLTEIVVDSVVPLGTPALVRFVCRCTGVLTATLQRPAGALVATVPISVPAR